MAERYVVLFDPRYHAISPVIIRSEATQATLDRDPWYESVFGRCPVIVELEQAHVVARERRVLRRWGAKHR